MAATDVGRGLLVALVFGCAANAPVEPPFEFPSHVPPPVVPADNPMTTARIELGRHLFYEQRLSVTGEIACGSCHHQDKAFTDGQATSEGADGKHGARSAMSLANLAWMSTYTWGNPILETLEQQALVPLFLDNPLEMGAQNVIDDVLREFAADPAYAARFRTAFPDDPEPFSVGNVAKALACFQRALISLNSPYDRHLAGDESALTPAQRRGLALFESERTGCSACHSGVFFTAAIRTEANPDGEFRFEVTGLYDEGASHRYPSPNFGLYEFSKDEAEMGAHRVPTLRNIAVTAPYITTAASRIYPASWTTTLPAAAPTTPTRARC